MPPAEGQHQLNATVGSTTFSAMPSVSSPRRMKHTDTMNKAISSGSNSSSDTINVATSEDDNASDTPCTENENKSLSTNTNNLNNGSDSSHNIPTRRLLTTTLTTAAWKVLPFLLPVLSASPSPINSPSPGTASRHSSSSSNSRPFSPSSFAKAIALVLLVLWHVHSVESIPPTEKLVQEIMASNRSAEEKFQAVLLVQHRRYCETSRTCGQFNYLGHCGYCRPCQCDDRCVLYGDCCPDKLLDGVDQAQPLELNWDCRDNLYAGYTPQQRQSRLANATRFLMTSSCPATTTATLANSCTDSHNYLPVSSSLSTWSSLARGREVAVFANKYCAQCHGVDVAKAFSWKTMVHCRTPRNFTWSDPGVFIQETMDDADCYMVYFPPPRLPPPRQCYYDDTMISSCNVTGAWPARDDFVERACAVYLDPKVAEGKIFQNVFCYICNSADPELFKACFRTPGLDPMPFSALLDFSGAIYASSRPRQMAQCGDSEIFDDIRNECRSVHCSPRRHFVDGQCPAVFDSAEGLGYSIYFSVHLDTQLDLYDGNDLLHRLPGSLEYVLIWKTLRDLVRTTHFEVSFEVTGTDGRCSQKSRMFSVFSTVKVTAKVSQDVLEQKLLDLRNMTLNVPLNAEMSLNFTTQVDERVWVDRERQGGGSQGTACSTKVSTHHPVLDGDEDAVYTRVNHLLTLPKVTLHQDEYHVQSSDLSLTVPWLDETVPLERYESTSEGNVFLSLEDFMPKLTNNRNAADEDDEAEVILSVVCTTLSLAGLALTFVTYVLFKPLRTTPGRNNMNLCLSLFLAQLFYLVGSGRTEVRGVCQALGLIIHYLWLAAFAAMAVCSYHMWHVFTSITTVSDHKDRRRRRFLQYTVFVWAVAAAIVVLTLLGHIIATGGDSIGYGEYRCYLTSPLAVAISVGIPVAAAVGSSLVFFWLTASTIRHSPKMTKSREDERHVWVYLKLSTLTGLTWTLAFLVFFTEVRALRYLFTVVNGLQGVFICLSFVFNRRVAKLYLSCRRPVHTSSTNASGRSSNSSTSTLTSSLRNATVSVSTVSRQGTDPPTGFTDVTIGKT